MDTLSIEFIYFLIEFCCGPDSSCRQTEEIEGSQQVRCDPGTLYTYCRSVPFLPLNPSPMSVLINQPTFPDPKMLARKARTFPLSRNRKFLLTESLGNNQPIIMISSSPTALVTMHNVKRFLEEATYVIFYCLVLIISG